MGQLGPDRFHLAPDEDVYVGGDDILNVVAKPDQIGQLAQQKLVVIKLVLGSGNKI